MGWLQKQWDKVFYNIECIKCAVMGMTKPDLQPVIDAIKAKKDYEPIVLCDVATGNPVIVTYSYDDTGLLVTTRTNPDGTPFTGTTGKCPNKNYGITSKQWFCVTATAEGISREDIVDLDTSTTVGTIWRDISGAVIAVPLAGSYKVGECKDCTPKPFAVQQKKYFDINTNICNPIEIIQFFDCNGNMTWDYFVLDSKTVPPTKVLASVAIKNFDANNVFDKCPENKTIGSGITCMVTNIPEQILTGVKFQGWFVGSGAWTNLPYIDTNKHEVGIIINGVQYFGNGLGSNGFNSLGVSTIQDAVNWYNSILTANGFTEQLAYTTSGTDPIIYIVNSNNVQSAIPIELYLYDENTGLFQLKSTMYNTEPLDITVKASKDYKSVQWVKTELASGEIIDNYYEIGADGKPLDRIPFDPLTQYIDNKCNCSNDIKIPKQQYVYGSAVGSVLLPFTDAREVIVHNRSTQDIIVTWVSSLGGSNSFIVPASGTNSISLVDSEGVFTSVDTAIGLYGAGTISNNSIIYNFKN